MAPAIERRWSAPVVDTSLLRAHFFSFALLAARGRVIIPGRDPMTRLTVGRDGEIALPDDLRHQYALRPEARVRMIETRSGILLVPLTDEPMSAELARELEQWQSLGTAAWDSFPFEDSDP